MTISQIAYAAGFGSTESLRRHFRAATGTGPRDYRQTFNAKAAKQEQAPGEPVRDRLRQADGPAHH
jgi:AraC-like DNA-binding protein